LAAYLSVHPGLDGLASAGAVRAAIAADVAPAAMRELAVADDVALGRLVAIPVPDIDLTLTIGPFQCCP